MKHTQEHLIHKSDIYYTTIIIDKYNYTITLTFRLEPE